MKLNCIDSIRGIAILMVILTHTGQSVAGLSVPVQYLAAYGQMGVQLFFIASAYTLCLSATTRRGEQHRIRKYAIRRFFRIAPVYYAGIALYFLVGAVSNQAEAHRFIPGEQYTPMNILANVLFIHGFVPEANNVVVPGGWSIGTEVAFYVLFPALFSMMSRQRSFGIVQGIRSLAVVMIFSQAVLALACRVTGLPMQNNSFLYYNLVVQLPVFILGMSLFFIDQKNAWPIKKPAGNLAGFVLCTAAAGFLWSRGQPWLFSIIPAAAGLSFAFLFVFLKSQPRLNPTFLGQVGVVSYSMYLFHFLFAHDVSRLISRPLAETLGPDIAFVVLFCLSAACSFALAWLSQRYFESFFIKLGSRIIARRSPRPTAAA